MLNEKRVHNIAPIVSIEGYGGCFHRLAARHFLDHEAEVLSCAAFGDGERAAFPACCVYARVYRRGVRVSE